MLTTLPCRAGRAMMTTSSVRLGGSPKSPTTPSRDTRPRASCRRTAPNPRQLATCTTSFTTTPPRLKNGYETRIPLPLPSWQMPRKRARSNPRLPHHSKTSPTSRKKALSKVRSQRSRNRRVAKKARTNRLRWLLRMNLAPSPGLALNQQS